MKLTKTELQAIKERAEEATIGKWYVEDGAIKTSGITYYDSELPAVIAETNHDSIDDEFIANARQDIPKLIERVEELQKIALELLEKYEFAEDTVINDRSCNGFAASKKLDEEIANYRKQISGEESE